jgi:hypothetical protein
MSSALVRAHTFEPMVGDDACASAVRSDVPSGPSMRERRALRLLEQLEAAVERELPSVLAKPCRHLTCPHR